MEIKEVNDKAKSSDVEAIWEENIKFAKDIENVGSWNVVGWHEALAKLIGMPVNVGHDLPDKMREEEEKKKDKEEEKKMEKVVGDRN